MTKATPRYLKELKFWTLHCSITALPSFLIAGFYLKYFKLANHTIAMLVGIGIFILAYAAFTTFVKPFHNSKSILSQTLKLALKIRLFVSVISIIFLLCGEEAMALLLFLPDYWAGFLAGLSLSFVSEQLMGLSHVSYPNFPPLFVLIWTLLEGVILSFLLFALCFCCLFIINIQRKRNWQKNNLPSPLAIASETDLTSS